MNQILRKALADASPLLEQLEIAPQSAFLLGNGDLTGLLMGDEQGFLIHLGKNDVWDQRLVMEDDQRIYTAAQVKEEAMAMPHGQTSFVVNLDSNLPVSGGKDSYDRPYPCPVICGKLRIHAELKGASHRLDLETATAESRMETGIVRTYISREHNLLLVEGLSPGYEAELIGVCHKDMEPPIRMERKNCQLLLQKMPGDRDTEDYWYAVGMRREQNRTNVLSTAIAKADHEETAVEEVMRLLDLSEANLCLHTGHIRAWEAYWSRSCVALTDQLLQNTWYRNLYALGCIARSGCASPALFCGSFTDTPAWHGDFHTNYNYQAVFWGAFITNHCDAAEVYDDLIVSYHKRARWIAKKVWNIEGAFYPLCIFYGEPEDPKGCREKNGRQYFHHLWSRTLGVSAMVAQNLLFHWYYDPSRELLEKIYPVLHDTTEFYIKLGDLRQAMTVSPEHWGIMPQLSLNYECTFDIALIKYLVRGTLQAAGVLGRDEEKRERWEQYLRQLPQYPTTDGYEAQLAAGNTEYLKDVEKCDCFRYDPEVRYGGRMIVDIKNAPPISYNIPAPVVPVFPGCDIDRASAGGEQKLALDSIRHMTTNGHNDFLMAAVSRIRMGTEDMRSYLREGIKVRQMKNGFLAFTQTPEEAYNSFGIYAEMLGITQAVSELLLQSNKGMIRLFPGMQEGEDAEFWDLLAEGGVLVSARCRKGTLTEAELCPGYDGRIRLILPEKADWTVVCEGEPVEGQRTMNQEGERMFEFTGGVGKRYRIKAYSA